MSGIRIYTVDGQAHEFRGDHVAVAQDSVLEVRIMGYTYSEPVAWFSLANVVKWVPL